MDSGKGSGRLVVMDADFLCAADECRKYGDRLKDIIVQYKQIMQYISMHGFVDGLITSNILSIVMEVEKYPDMIDDAINEINTLLNSYVKEIDEADKFVY